MHRDLKSENILLNDTLSDVTIIDFGLSLEVNSTNGMIQKYGGTLHYAAPEISLRKPFNGFLADIWSVGIILVELLMGGHVPQVGSSPIPSLLYSTVSCDTLDLLKRMLSIDPVIRWTCDQLLKHPALVFCEEENEESSDSEWNEFEV